MHLRIAALVALGLLVVATVAFVVRPKPSSRTVSVTRQTVATASPAATLAPAPTAPPATKAPANTPTPVSATATPQAAATPVAAKSAVPAPRLSPDRPPEIVAVNLSSKTVHPGDVVSGTVETSSNVASVEAHLATYAIPMQKVGVGKFVLSYRVPDIPFFFRGKTYAIDILAHNTRGDTARASVPVTVQ